MASRSRSVISLFLSAKSLNLAKASLRSSLFKSYPRSSNLARTALLPLNFPKEILLSDNPTVFASIISYVSLFFNTPSWCIPDSCAKAFAPTIALFGCTTIPVKLETKREDLVISSVLTAVKGVGDSGGLPKNGLKYDLLT